MLKPIIALVGAGVLAAACTTTGNTERTPRAARRLARWLARPSARCLATSASGQARRSAPGSAAVVGAVKGCREDGGCGANAPNRRQYYDERAGRYYYYDSATGRYYWENGTPALMRERHVLFGLDKGRPVTPAALFLGRG